jgi:hypothetical protein
MTGTFMPVFKKGIPNRLPAIQKYSLKKTTFADLFIEHT